MAMLQRLFAPVAVLLLTLSAMAGTVALPVAAQEAESYYVRETRQHIGEPFLSAWLEMGGPDMLGMPVTSAGAPNTESAQYFERGALRIEDDGDVAAIPVGRVLLDRPDPSNTLRTGRRTPAPRETRPFSALRAAPSGDAVTFDAETGHAVKGSMLSAYEEFGGADTLGAPLSEAFVSGAVRVQWFEMGRLEHRGDGVTSGPVGAQLAILDGADRSPRSRGRLATFDLATVLAARDGGTGGNLAGSTGTAGIADSPVSPDGAGTSFAPARIAIPAIGVDASIESIGIDGGVMGVPSNPWNVGWYSGLGGPGGNTVMAGHKDWASIGPVVFYSLGALGAGNEIFLYDGAGNAATYVVYETFAVDAYADSGSIIGDQGGDTLTLITCGGDFNGSMYDLRVIVRARRSA